MLMNSGEIVKELLSLHSAPLLVRQGLRVIPQWIQTHSFLGFSENLFGFVGYIGCSSSIYVGGQKSLCSILDLYLNLIMCF